jgi:hypothetical protein
METKILEDKYIQEFNIAYYPTSFQEEGRSSIVTTIHKHFFANSTTSTRIFRGSSSIGMVESMLLTEKFRDMVRMKMVYILQKPLRAPIWCRNHHHNHH